MTPTRFTRTHWCVVIADNHGSVFAAHITKMCPEFAHRLDHLCTAAAAGANTECEVSLESVAPSAHRV